MKKKSFPKTASNKNTKGKSGAKKDFLVVGLGASAGGIKALKEFFANVPKDSGSAYVVILHLSPEHESKLAEILQLTASIPVRQVHDEKIKVKPDCVYVIPPDRSLEMSDGHLSTSPVLDYEERQAPVDIFFRTLAESHGSYAVSVILSGTGSDGSMGVKRVKEKGGIIFVQDPKEAEFDDMPRNSIATGLVDFVLSAAAIPAQINVYKNQLGKVRLSPKTEDTSDEKDEKALLDVFTNLRVRTGHDFSNYRRATVLRRIERRMNVRGITDLSGYAQFLRVTAEESQALLRDLLISVTNFFRDRESFGLLEQEIIPKILENKTARDSVRIWVAGCATGEEAYSIAMLFAEQTASNLKAPIIQIFATDIDESAIAQARAGLYTNSDVADVSPERLLAFFQKEGENFRVRREIREMALFAIHNVAKDPPFSNLDMVTCRNLLIYLNRMAQSRVMESAHFALKPGGYLFLGSSESADAAGDLFAEVDKKNRIFQSRPIATRLSLPLPNYSLTSGNNIVRSFFEMPAAGELRAPERTFYTALHRQILELYAPPSVIINEDFDILHISESAGRYMRLPGGEPSRNLLHIARPELRLELRNALYRAKKNKTAVTIENLQVKTDNRAETINIIARPAIGDDPKRGYILVIFEPSHAEAAKKGIAGKTEAVKHNEPVVRQIEEELIQTKLQLQSTVEQYEVQNEELKASNEELQSVNEELRSAVEEIETSKEELQSVNEELQTVNQELKIKIEELSQSNNDLQNLINSNDIGTVFLDRKLNVKLFTKPITDMFNLLASDIGRPLSDITKRFEYDGLLADIEQVLKTLRLIEREVKTTDGGWFLMRISPYRTSEDQISGTVITFLEITERVKNENSIRFQANLLDAINQSVIATDLEGTVIFWNRLAERLYGWTAKEAVGRNILELTTPEMATKKAVEIMKQARGGKSWSGEFKVRRRDGATFQAEVFNSPILDAEGKVTGVIGVSFDSAERRRRERQIHLNEERLRLLIESATDYAIFTLSKDNIINSWNTGAERIFGWKEKEIIGKDGVILFTPEDRECGVHKMEMRRAIDTGKAEDQRWHVRQDGSYFYASGVMQPLSDNEGFVKICRDETERIKTETALKDKEMLKQLVVTQEDERRRIARDIHDHLGQQLTSLRLKLESVRKSCNVKKLCGEIEDAQKVAEQLDRDVDFLAWELRPAALDDLGLRVTLANFVKEWSLYAQIKTDFHTSGLGKKRLSFEIETNLYRIAQEALNNIQKHAKAKNVSVLLEKRDDIVTLIVEDDGVGFNPKDKMNRTKSIGLVSMSERAAICGGEFEIESKKNKGATIFVRVPIGSQENKK